MRRIRSRRIFAVVLLAALYACSGCASIQPLRANGPGQASCDGAFTEVDGRTMNLSEASTFYQRQGSMAAAAKVKEARVLRSQGAESWLPASVIGALIGAVTGIAIYKTQPQAYGDSYAGILTLFNAIFGGVIGFGVGTPFGLYHAATIKGHSMERAVEAAMIYNRQLAAHEIFPASAPANEPPASHSLPGMP